jgi:hypothetical protein
MYMCICILFDKLVQQGWSPSLTCCCCVVLGGKLSLFEGGVRTPALLGGPYLQRILQQHHAQDKDTHTDRSTGIDYPGTRLLNNIYIHIYLERNVFPSPLYKWSNRPFESCSNGRMSFSLCHAFLSVCCVCRLVPRE